MPCIKWTHCVLPVFTMSTRNNIKNERTNPHSHTMPEIFNAHNNNNWIVKNMNMNLNMIWMKMFATALNSVPHFFIFNNVLRCFGGDAPFSDETWIHSYQMSIWPKKKNSNGVANCFVRKCVNNDNIDVRCHHPYWATDVTIDWIFKLNYNLCDALSRRLVFTRAEQNVECVPSCHEFYWSGSKPKCIEFQMNRYKMVCNLLFVSNFEL